MSPMIATMVRSGTYRDAIVAEHIVPGEPRQLIFVTDTPTPDPVPVEHHLVQSFLSHGPRSVELSLGLLDDDLKLAGQLARVDD